jgi:hypothetical protein
MRIHHLYYATLCLQKRISRMQSIRAVTGPESEVCEATRRVTHFHLNHATCQRVTHYLVFVSRFWYIK